MPLLLAWPSPAPINVFGLPPNDSATLSMNKTQQQDQELNQLRSHDLLPRLRHLRPRRVSGSGELYPDHPLDLEIFGSLDTSAFIPSVNSKYAILQEHSSHCLGQGRAQQLQQLQQLQG